MKKSLVAMLITSLLSFNANAAQEVVKKEEKEKEFEYQTSNKAPEGFEDLLNSTNYGFIDVYFANRYLGSFQSEYNSETLTFTDSEEIYNLLNKEVTFLNPESILSTLKQPMQLNSQYNCLNNEICEKFIPETIGIVFDDTTLSAKIFLNYEQIKESEFDYTTLLAPSTSKNSFVQSLDLNFFGGTDQEETEYSLSGGTYLAHKEHRIKSSWIKSQNDFYFNQLFYGTDYKGYKVKAGYMTSDSFGYTFTPTFRMLGIEYGTSINTRKDLQTEFSEPLHVFLNQRAAIKVTRDQELIYTAYHEGGNQMIPTDNFPSGSYNVNIEIIEDNGNTRNIKKFFVKSISIPPKDENLFYFNLGYMEEGAFEEENADPLSAFNLDNEEIDLFPETEKEVFLKLGNSSRWNDQTALYNEILYKETDYLYNPTVYFLGDGYDLKTSFLYGSGDAKGVTLDINIPFEQHNFSLFGRYVSENDNSLVFGEGTSITASYNVNIDKYGSLSLFTSYDKSAVTDVDNTTYSLGYRNNLYQDSKNSLNFNFDISKNDQETFVNVGFTYYFNSDSNWSLKTNPSWQRQGEVEDYRLNNSLRVSGENSRNTQWHANLNTNNSKNSKNVLLNTSIRDQRYGTASVDVNHDYTNASKTTYLGNITTNIVSDTKSFAIGGKQRLESGVIIDLTKYEKEDDFELYINEIPTDYIKSNNETFIPLEPYKEYNMYLKSKSEDNFIQVKRKSDFVVPYPGNVQSLSWDINRISILSSQLIDEFGYIIKSTPVYIDSNKTYTDEVGFFQIEVIDTDERLWASVNEKECSVNIKDIMIEDIVYKDELICYYEDGVTESEVAPEKTIEPVLTLAGVPQKDIADSINETFIDVNKFNTTPIVENIVEVTNITNSCYEPYGQIEYTIAKNDTIANIVRNKVVEKNAPYLEISPIIKDIVKCNNLQTPDSISVGDKILIPNLNSEINIVEQEVVEQKSKIEEDNNSSINVPTIVAPVVTTIPVPVIIPDLKVTNSGSKNCYANFEEKEHIITSKDTLSGFARNVLGYKVSYTKVSKLIKEIAQCNNLDNPDFLIDGELIIIPVSDFKIKEKSKIEVKPIVVTESVVDLSIENINSNIQSCYTNFEEKEHIITSKDTLSGFARNVLGYKVSYTKVAKLIKEITECNNLDNPDLLVVGQKIRIPFKHLKTEPSGVYIKNNQQCYIVQKGDWLHKISRRFMPKHSNWVDMQKMVMLISKENNIKNPNDIEIGQEICIPDPELIKNINIYKTKVEDIPKEEIKTVFVQPQTSKKDLINQITNYLIKDNFIKESDRELFILYLKIKIPDNLKAWDNIRDYNIIIDTTFQDVCIKLSKLDGKLVFFIEEKKE